MSNEKDLYPFTTQAPSDKHQDPLKNNKVDRPKFSVEAKLEKVSAKTQQKLRQEDSLLMTPEAEQTLLIYRDRLEKHKLHCPSYGKLCSPNEDLQHKESIWTDEANFYIDVQHKCINIEDYEDKSRKVKDEVRRLVAPVWYIDPLFHISHTYWNEITYEDYKKYLDKGYTPLHHKLIRLDSQEFQTSRTKEEDDDERELSFCKGEKTKVEGLLLSWLDYDRMVAEREIPSWGNHFILYEPVLDNY